MTFPFLFGPFLGDKKIGWHGIRSVGPTFAIDLPSWGFFDKIRNEKLHYNMFSLSSMAHDTADTHKSCFEQLLLTTFFTDIFPSPSFLSRIAPFTLEVSPWSDKSNLEVWQLIKVSTGRLIVILGGWLLWMVHQAHSTGGSLIYHDLQEVVTHSRVQIHPYP